MKNKKGIELSVNFLVIIIISLAMLGMAILLFKNFFQGAQKIQANYDQQTEQELEALLIAGKKVAIPFTRKEVKPGSTAVFGLGILSLLGGDTDFYISVKCSKFIKYDGNTDPGCPLAQDALYPLSKTLKNNENIKIPIVVPTHKDAEAGTYVYDVCVCDEGECSDCPPSDATEQYDATSHKLYVKIAG